VTGFGGARPGSASEAGVRRRRDVESALQRLSTSIEQQHSRDPDRLVRRVCSDAHLAAEFVHGTRDSDDDLLNLALTRDPEFLDTLERLGQHVLPLEGTLSLVASEQSAVDLHPRLLELDLGFRTDLGPVVEAFVRVVDTVTSHGGAGESRRMKALTLADGVRTRLYERNLLADLEETRRQATDILTEAKDVNRSARKMASGTAANKLAEYFHDDSRTETRTADRLRVSAILGLVAVTAIAVFLLITRADQTTVAGELLKLSLTIPVAGLSAYLAHESTRHRTAARASAELAIALNTLPSYIANLEDDEGARELRRALGMRIFAEPREPGATGPDADANVVDDVHRILVRIEELLGGGSR